MQSACDEKIEGAGEHVAALGERVAAIESRSDLAIAEVCMSNQSKFYEGRLDRLSPGASPQVASASVGASTPSSRAATPSSEHGALEQGLT